VPADGGAEYFFKKHGATCLQNIENDVEADVERNYPQIFEKIFRSPGFCAPRCVGGWSF